jgi:hypothetical protein
VTLIFKLLFVCSPIVENENSRTVLPHLNHGVSLFRFYSSRCTIVPLYHCTIVPLYHHNGTQMTQIKQIFTVFCFSQITQCMSLSYADYYKIHPFFFLQGGNNAPVRISEVNWNLVLSEAGLIVFMHSYSCVYYHLPPGIPTHTFYIHIIQSR